MSFADLPGVRMCFERGGAGPPVMVVNGTGSDLRNKPSPLDWPLVGQFEIVAYDHRVLGRSEPTDPEYQPTMADFATDAIALADHLGWDRFSLVGVSFGGMVGQEIAIRFGDRIERLILACTSSGGPGHPSYPLHELYNRPADQAAADWLAILDTRAAEKGPFRDGLAKALSARPRAETTPPGLLKQLEARRLHDTWDRLGAITADTLVAAGKYDGIAPLGNCEALASQIPNAKLRIYDGGHLFMMQDPAVFPEFSAFLSAGY